MIDITDISFNQIIVEMGYGSGTEHSIQEMTDMLDDYSTNAYHAADSWRDMGGFSGSSIWHFLLPYSFEDIGTDVRVHADNWSNNTQSGTFYYEIYDAGDNLLANGSVGSGNISAETYFYMDLPYAAGTPSYIKWRWHYTLAWNISGVSS